MRPRARLCACLVLLAGGVHGCAATGSGEASGSVYPGTGFYEPWVWGPAYREPPIVVGPPPRPVHPIAPAPRPPPRPMPR